MKTPNNTLQHYAAKWLALSQRCEICRASAHKSNTNSTVPLCSNCKQQLPWISRSCRSCGEPITNHTLCARCKQQALPFLEVIIPLRYDFPINHWIGTFKYQTAPGMAFWLAQILSEQVLARGSGFLPRSPNCTPTIISGIPSHPQKQRQRGYNQSQLLARHVAKQLQLPIDFSLTKKVRNTANQRTLNAGARHVNLIDAFEVTPKGNTYLQISSANVILIDDVVTTGATSAELAHCLLKAGANSVSLWALAKTPLS
ncbi:competence protein ComF [gamma proteobacterium HdN1]|nr:competence protein ComF [gamma proteobacterium HdN1]